MIMRRVIVALMLTFLFGKVVYPVVEIVDIISDMDNDESMIDDDLMTGSVSSSNYHTIIVQFGKPQYINAVEIIFDQKVEIDSIDFLSSDNFIFWKSILSDDDINTIEYESDFDDLFTAYLKITIQSDNEFQINDIVFYEDETPENALTDLEISDITETSAVISWDTEIPNMTYFYYKKRYNGEQEMLVEMNYKTEHEIKLSGLLKGNEYYYQIVSEAPDGSRIVTEQKSLTTAGVPLPEFWYINAEYVTPFSAKISYTANIDTKYKIYLGTATNDMELIESSKKYTTENDIEILGLQPETLYYTQLYIEDKKGNITYTTPLSFETLPHNIALGKDVWGTFDYEEPLITNKGFGSTGVENITDGDLNYFGGMAISYLLENSDQYVIIDLGAEETFKKINVYWWGLAYSENYRIDLSDDGITWTTVKKNLNAEDGEDMRSDDGDYIVLHSIDLKKTARFVRLYAEAGTEIGTRLPQVGEYAKLMICEIAVIEDL